MIFCCFYKDLLDCPVGGVKPREQVCKYVMVSALEGEIFMEVLWPVAVKEMRRFAMLYIARTCCKKFVVVGL